MIVIAVYTVWCTVIELRAFNSIWGNPSVCNFLLLIELGKIRFPFFFSISRILVHSTQRLNGDIVRLLLPTLNEKVNLVLELVKA